MVISAARRFFRSTTALCRGYRNVMIYALLQNNAFGASSVLCSGVSLSLFLQILLEMLLVCVVPTLLLIVNFESCTHECLRLIFFLFFFQIIPSFSLFHLIFAPSCPACLLPLELLLGNFSRPPDPCRGQILLLSSRVPASLLSITLFLLRGILVFLLEILSTPGVLCLSLRMVVVS
jgi:hypothetical protein